MSNAARGVRFPKALLLLPQGEYFTEEQIAEKCDVSSRTAYRWYTQGWLKRSTEGKLTTYALNDKLAPKVVINAKSKAPNRFTKAELESIYQKVIDRELKLKPADVNQAIIDEESIDILEQILKALEDYHELVSFIIMNKR